MGFETVMLSVVKDVARNSRATFMNGSLFVIKVDAEEANRILTNLKHFARCDVQMTRNKVTGEYAYDFV